MADEKRNPLLGAFRSPAPGTAPTTGTPGTSTPIEDKKSDVPPKVAVDPKTTPPVGTPAPGKPVEDKKPSEPPKAAIDPKTTPPIPGKPGEAQKPADPPKTPTDSKTTPPAGTTAPAKPDEGKKPDEPPKSPSDSKTAPPAVTSKPGEEKKPAEPGKTPADTKTTPPADTTVPGKPGEGTAPAEPEVEIPKNFVLPLTKTGVAEIITTLKVAEIHPFEGHPFSVKDDQAMWDLVESIKQFGVLEPITVIPRKEGGYEMVSGHRRQRACQLAGIETMPVIVRNLDRDEATISMVDANLKRENITPMEKARAYSMKLEAMKRKAGRLSKADILGGAKPMRADEQLAQQTGESRATIQRTARLVNLEPELQKLVDEKKLPVNTGADISYLKKDEQKKLVDAIEKEGGKVPSGTQAAELKEASKAGNLTTEKIESTVAPTKREVDPPLKVTFNEDELRDYFPDKGTTVGTVKRTMFEALDLRKKALERQAKAVAEKNAPAKKPDLAR